MQNGASNLQLESLPIHRTRTLVLKYKNITKISFTVYFVTLFEEYEVLVFT